MRIDFFVLKARALDVAGKAGLGGLQKLFVVASGKVGLVMRAARLIAQQRAQHDGSRKLQHVLQLAGEGKAGVGPLAAVAQVHVLVAVEQFDDLFVGLLEALVVADDGGVLGHGLAQLAPQLEGILRALVVEQLGVDFGLAGNFGSVAAVALGGGQALGVLQRVGAGLEAAIDAADAANLRPGDLRRGTGTRTRRRQRCRECWSSG